MLFFVKNEKNSSPDNQATLTCGFVISRNLRWQGKGTFAGMAKLPVCGQDIITLCQIYTVVETDHYNKANGSNRFACPTRLIMSKAEAVLDSPPP